MEPLRKYLPSIIGKLGSESPVGELTWECQAGEIGEHLGTIFTRAGCGMIEPLKLPTGRYIRRSCPCEREAKAAAVRQAEHDTWMLQQASFTYGWLGHRWSDLSLVTKSLDNFDFDRQPDAYHLIKTFTKVLHGSLVLHGPYGTGKTHILAAICNARRENGKKSLFCTAPSLFAAIQSCIGRNEDRYTIIDAAVRTPLLVIDDVDKAKPSEFREEIYFEILDRRTREGKPTAISTNRIAELDTYIGGACASRLMIGQIEIEMTGDDYRREM